HAFKIPQDSPFARFDFKYAGKEYEKGFGRQVLGESWAGHYGTNHKMSTRLDIVPAAKRHPALRGVEKPWVQSGGYWTEPKADSEVLAMAQPLQGMTADSPPAQDKQPCPGVWVRRYETKKGEKGRVFTTTYGASEDLLNDDFRRLLVNACFWGCGLENDISPQLDVSFVGPYQPSTFRFNGHRQGVQPSDLQGWQTPILPNRDSTSSED
ncbi:MAG: ThuA domain-containing protein, partial [Blastopirellula sp. JB062]